MAISDALRYQLNTGGSADTLYGIIRDFLAKSPDAATTQAQMDQYGISGEDVANATGGASGGLLSGNILAGASWNSANTALQNQLTETTGQATSNYAVGGATTADTLNQLNTYLAGGGQFDPNATVFLQTGGVDFLQGVDKGTIKDNINQIVKTLGDQGVNVVLTGSPYAKSVEDVVNNNFNPEVDQLFKDVAKENSNVALVGTQGEILQNKTLLVDALHTNAEGTAVYNQSVIDALSQFKNEVPSSTPQAIAQAYQTNTVATTPSVITQAAENPVVAQSLARAIPTARGTVIEGDDIEAQIAGVPQVVYETRVDPNNTANYETYNPQTGEVISRGTFPGGGSKSLLEASRPVLALAASVLGAPYLSNLIGGATGLTGSALAGATGATIAGGSTALTGGSAEDTLRAALIGGGGGYLGNEFNNYLDTGTFGDVGITERQFAIQDARQLASQGLSTTQITDTLLAGGYNDITVQRALSALTGTPVASLPTPGAVNVTGAAAPAINAGGLLSSLNAPVTQAGTVNVTGTSSPQMVDQAALALVNNQLASNLGTPANLANVEITGNRPATTQEITNAILATVPNVTLQQAQTQAEVLVTSGQNIKVSDLVTAVSSVSPTITNTVAEQIITAPRSTTPVGQNLASFPASLVSSVPSTTTTPDSRSTLERVGTNVLGTGLLSLLNPNLIAGGLGTAGNLLQMQTSREAAQRAQTMIDAETKAAKDAAQFRPIGMTTRFGTSQFGFDPATGRLSSAGYALTPDVKAQQDRFMALSNQGLTQAEGAQAQFAPLQTGAQRLFGLGNQYLAKSPEAVAQNYLNQQMALLQPGRETELANLQNRLQQQGRGGLSVAQGGTMGATTPELQALFNARAQQEAQLAANAQQAGQRDVLFGAGLLGQGSQAMGQYYSGQQAAYAPYTTALGQAQTLETLGQQPYNMGVNLGQIGAQAGANVGTLGLRGAGLSTALATSADATRNLGAQSLIAAGNPNAQFGQAIGSAASGLFGNLFGGTPVNALSSSGYGPGNAGFQNMINDIYGERVIGSLYG